MVGYLGPVTSVLVPPEHLEMSCHLVTSWRSTKYKQGKVTFVRYQGRQSFLRCNEDRSEMKIQNVVVILKIRLHERLHICHSSVVHLQWKSFQSELLEWENSRPETSSLAWDGRVRIEGAASVSVWEVISSFGPQGIWASMTRRGLGKEGRPWSVSPWALVLCWGIGSFKKLTVSSTKRTKHFCISLNWIPLVSRCLDDLDRWILPPCWLIHRDVAHQNVQFTESLYRLVHHLLTDLRLAQVSQKLKNLNSTPFEQCSPDHTRKSCCFW